MSGTKLAPRRAGAVYAAWRKFRRNRASLVGGAIIAFVCLVALSAPVIAPYDPRELHYGAINHPPCAQFWSGTDNHGRDVFSFVVWGARVSLVVALGAVLIELVIGLIIGVLAGYFGGIVDNVLMSITDLFLILPPMVLLIVAVSMLQVRSIIVIMIIMGVLTWPWMTRVVRSEVLSLKESLFVEAAKSMGANDLRIIFKHILPNGLSPIIVLATLDLAWFILYEAMLSFLGLGDPTAVSWGTLINAGRLYLRTAWWTATFPGLAIFFTILGLNLLGDGLRDALDVKIGRA